MGAKNRYKVIIKTADVSKAGTDEDVYLQLINRNNGLKTSPQHLDKGGYNDFERGDCDTYIVTDEDIGEITHLGLALVKEGEYAGGVDLTVAAEHKGASGAVTFYRVDRWGSGHNSPMWRPESIQVYRHMDQNSFSFLGRTYNFEAPRIEAAFTIDRWVAPGDVLEVARD